MTSEALRILVCPDSFKAALDSASAARSIAAGIARRRPDVDIDLMPLADGGEGTLDALSIGAKMRRETVLDVTMADGTRGNAHIGWLDRDTALVEAAQACGRPGNFSDPFRATSVGVGQLVRRAVERGASRVCIALGGSRTVDCGLGMLHGLGARLFDADDRVLDPIGALGAVDHIDPTGLDACLEDVEIEVWRDVESPLLGPSGARLYMAQKGASDVDADVLHRGLRRCVAIYGRDLPFAGQRAIHSEPGAGSAGGLGAACFAIGADSRPGIDAVLEQLDATGRIARADWLVTGEGRVDEQTLAGKVVAGVARRAAEAAVGCIALCGSRTDDESVLAEIQALGVTAVLPIGDGPGRLEDALPITAQLLSRTAQQMVALLTPRRRRASRD